MGIHNKKVELGEDNKGWCIEYPLFKMCNKNVATRRLDINGLRISNILKTKIEKQTPENSETVVQRIFIVWIY